jgi:hypothetical protein
LIWGTTSPELKLSYIRDADFSLMLPVGGDARCQILDVETINLEVETAGIR